MDKIELQRRTKKFAIDIIRFASDLPNNRSINILNEPVIKKFIIGWC
jgi:hypothetical protein